MQMFRLQNFDMKKISATNISHEEDTMNDEKMTPSIFC